MSRLFLYITTTGIFFLLLLFPGCGKEDIPCMNCDDCRNFPEPEGFGIGTIKYKPLERKAPCFNPNNANEFIYVKEEGNKKALIKYDLIARQETVLIENVQIIGQPKWGRNGWIVFSDAQYQLSIILDNGQSLKTITSEYSFLHPHWLNDSIIACEFSFNLGVPYYYCELQMNGRIRDTIKGSSYIFGASNNINESACLLYRSDPNIRLGVNGKLTTSVTNNGQNNGRNTITGITWHPDNQTIFYSTYREGLYRINKSGKMHVQVRNGCDSRSYRYLSISSDGKKILVERVDATDFDNKHGSWTEEAKIVIMDVNGQNERNVFD